MTEPSTTTSGDRTFWAIVPAAGSGTRMESELPKQYLEIKGKSILEYTLEKLLSSELVCGVVVCLARNDSCWNNLEVSRNKKIVVVNGGKERMHSVYNALTFLEKEHNLKDEFILVHDAVRPCVQREDIEKLIRAGCMDDVGAVLATPVVDTLKKVDSENRISETLDRTNCWRAQTPQMFRLTLLRKCIEVLLNRNQTASDEAAVVEASGFKAIVVEGAQENIKLTLPADLPLMESILVKQMESGVGGKQ